MTVLDLGCGNGFCTFDICTLLDGEGCVVAADIQQDMLDMLEKKIGHGKDGLIRLHKCNAENTGITQTKFDFILLFYMFHEMPDKAATLAELKTLLYADGKIMISEPMFHVKRKAYLREEQIVRNAGYRIIDCPKIFFSRTMVIATGDVNDKR